MNNHFYILVAVLLLLCIAAAPPAEAGDTISVPVRWCVIGNDINHNGTFDPGETGALAFTNPGGVLNGQGMPEPDTDNVLWRRHERASDNVWIPEVNITFRSGFTAAVRDQAHFPVIPDPDTSIGQYGDVVDPTIDDTEVKAVISGCENAWQSLSTQFNTPLLGPVAINIARFIDKSGNPRNLRGWGGFGSYSPGNIDRCRNPEQLTAVGAGYVLIQDNQSLAGGVTLRTLDPQEVLLAHEFGHSLTLEHGNGLDDNNNGVFDGYGAGQPGCDPAEDPNAMPFSLMTPGMLVKTITGPDKPSQVFTTRAAGKVYSGATLDPPAALVNGDVIGDQRVDAINDVADPAVDLVWLTLSENTAAQTTSIGHKVLGTIPLQVDNEYLLFADLDNTASTGGAPSVLGFNTSFQGAELVTRVEVTFGGPVEFPERIINKTVWKFQNGSFVQVNDPSIQATVLTANGENHALFDVVTLEMANSVRGPRGSQIRIQAVAHQLLQPNLLDRLPDDTGGGSGMNIVPEIFPACTVSPSPVNPGAATNVVASGLVPNRTSKIMVGDILVGLPLSDGNGNVNFNFVIPTDSRQGLRLMTVGTMGTALTADCTVDVEGPTVVVVQVPVDVHPTSCPNPFNTGKQGTLPVAILGTSTLDVTQIDPASIRLQGIAPRRLTYQDVATPFSPFIGKTGANACTTAGADGFTDLSLFFDAKQISAALGALTSGQTVTLHLTGFFLPQFGGAPIVGEDVVVIKK